MTNTFYFKAVLFKIDTLYPYHIFQTDLGNEEVLYRIHRKNVSRVPNVVIMYGLYHNVSMQYLTDKHIV